MLAGCLTQPSLDREALLDPAACESCHPDHYRQWSGSMHAYSSDDPVFVALNGALQRESAGAAGSFCVQCHAPMALREGATVDGLNLAELPRRLRGVTCLFCHEIDAVEGDHNAAVRLARDGVMRGSIGAGYTEAHDSRYSPLHDGRDMSSANLCGACHDVITPAGLHLERTLAEWQESVFAQPGRAALTCNRCHMPGSDGPAAAVAGAPIRRLHDHGFPGIDVALSPWLEEAAQLAGIERDLQPSVRADLCVTPTAGGVVAEVMLDNVFAGHSWPSGATHARRAWVELVATAADLEVFSSGAVAAGQAIATLDDPSLWLLRTRLYDADDREVHRPWQAVRAESELLPAAVTNDPNDPRYYHARSRTYAIGPLMPDRISMRLLVRAVGLEMMQELVQEELLDPAVPGRMPTFDLQPAALTWTAADGYGCVLGGSN